MNRQEIDEILSLNRPGKLKFNGCTDAEVFTKEVEETLAAMLDQNFVTEEGPRAGFLLCTMGHRPWWDTTWTRDNGTILRELVSFGYFGHAALLCDCMMRLVLPNADGYYSFPERFKDCEPGSGNEIDGTSALLIGMAMLVRRLRTIENPVALREYNKIMEFVTRKKSSLRFLLDTIEKDGLIAGTGEFGGGMHVDGAWCNVVQNMLTYLAAHAWRGLLAEIDPALAERCVTISDQIAKNIQTHMTSPEGWVWCVRPGDFAKIPEVLNAPANKGFTGVNGASAMYADVFGLTPVADGWWGTESAICTYQTLLNRPHRRKLFDAYGMYVQFEIYDHGMLVSPAYGQGYAIQTALILDQPEVGRLLHYLSYTTENPHPNYKLDRDSKYWFYERMLAPEYFELPIEQQDVDQGCGALNIVCIAEPLKCSRLVAGLDDTGAQARIVPRLPEGWESVELTDWPVLHKGKLYQANITYSKKDGLQVSGLPFELNVVK